MGEVTPKRREQLRRAMRSYQQKNREKLRRKAREYRLRTKPARAAYMRHYRRTNPEIFKRIEAKRKRPVIFKQKFNAYHKKWSKAHQLK